MLKYVASLISETAVVTTDATPSSVEILAQLKLWNNTKAPYPQLCVHTLFEQQVKCTPQDIAVESSREQLTYKQLNSQANQLASYIRHLLKGNRSSARTCTPRDMRVMLYMERSEASMLVGFWGIIKAGCAVVLTDTELPVARVAHTLEEAQPQLIVTHSTLLSSLPPHNVPTLCLDTAWEQIGQQPDKNLRSLAGIDDIAYLITTSGTTGRPKVVRVAHRGLSNLYAAHIETLGVQPGDRLLQYPPMNFDGFVADVIMAHLAGATLVLGTPASLQPGYPLFELMRSRHITITTLTPSVLSVMPGHHLPDLRILLSAGEACTTGLVERWAPGRKFVNAFGPAEDTICFSLAECLPDGNPPTIGRPLQNQRGYVITQDNRLAGVGEVGELYIAGVGLAAGYTRQDLTMERFTTPHIQGVHEKRWYRTGDLVAWLPDGRLEYKGRVEGEYVKIHGVRVEPREIEQVLLEHPAVERSAVVDRSDANGQTILVAFVILKAEQSEQQVVSQLWQQLEQRLPRAVLPRTLLPLASFPITQQGKLDRRTLQSWPLPQAIQADPDYVAPRNELERLLVEHFTPILNMDGKALGIDTKITRLRSDSFSIAHIAAEIKKATGVYVQEFRIARNPTIRAITDHVEKERARTAK